MSKQIIVLDQNSGEVGTFSLRVAFWIPQNPALPNPGITASSWSGASNPELVALQNGTILEVVRAYTFPIATPVATVKSTLNAAYAALVAALPSKSAYYGVFYDSVSFWSA